MVIQHLKQIGKVKNLDKWVPHELTTDKKKIIILKCRLLLFYAMTMNHFSIRLWCEMKLDFIWQPATTSSVAGPRSFKALPKAKLAPKKGLGYFLVVCCWSNPLQLSEFQRNHYIWEVCSANQCVARKTALPATSTGQQNGSMTMPTTHRITNASKVGWIGLQSFASSTIFTWPLANQLLLLQPSWQLFAGRMFPQAAGCRKCFPRVCLILKHGFLHDRDK